MPNPFKKLFTGHVTESFFTLSGAEVRWPLNSHYIEGTYRGDENHTDIDVKLKRDDVVYIGLRSFAFGFYLFAQFMAYDFFDIGDFLKMQFPIALLLFPIVADLSHKKNLVDNFHKEMKIIDARQSI